jgi:hypothetical protein
MRSRTGLKRASKSWRSWESKKRRMPAVEEFQGGRPPRSIRKVSKRLSNAIANLKKKLHSRNAHTKSHVHSYRGGGCGCAGGNDERKRSLFGGRKRTGKKRTLFNW